MSLHAIAAVDAPCALPVALLVAVLEESEHQWPESNLDLIEDLQQVGSSRQGVVSSEQWV